MSGCNRLSHSAKNDLNTERQRISLDLDIHQKKDYQNQYEEKPRYEQQKKVRNIH